MLRRSNERMESTLVILGNLQNVLPNGRQPLGRSDTNLGKASWFKNASHTPKSLRYSVVFHGNLLGEPVTWETSLCSPGTLSPSLDVSMSFPILASPSSFLIAGFNTKNIPIC